jgi:hypothetical protein
LSLDRLPTPEEVATIREALDIRKRRDPSPETLSRLRSQMSRYKSAVHGQIERAASGVADAI